MTLICCPIEVAAPDQSARPIETALADARAAREAGADLVEWRIDPFMLGIEGESERRYRLHSAASLLTESALPCILTARPIAEGGAFEGEDEDRLLFLEELIETAGQPPRYLDIELATYDAHAEHRGRIEALAGPDRATSLILSLHDFEGVPPDLNRRMLRAFEADACSVMKIAVRARSLRDNLDLFDLLMQAPKPTIALGMGEFGLMSRVLAPKFGGFLTFASLRAATVTAPGQPTIRELLETYRFRSIGKATRVYGVIGWPVAQSKGPLIHNAGFAEVGHDGVYLPLPIAADAADIEGSRASLKATVDALMAHERLGFGGASVTSPHKEAMRGLGIEHGWQREPLVDRVGAANTLACGRGATSLANTDVEGLIGPLEAHLGQLSARRIGIVGAGGVARAAAFGLAERGATVILYNRTRARAAELAGEISTTLERAGVSEGRVVSAPIENLPKACCEAFINATPLGMAGGPDPDAVAMPIGEMKNLGKATVFFDTVYNPLETPLLRAARDLGYQAIDGARMFTRQAARQFSLWTGSDAPSELFDRVARASGT